MTNALDTPEKRQQAKAETQARRQAKKKQQAEGSPAPARHEKKLRFDRIGDILNEPYPKDCIQGVYPETGVAVLAGGSGDGKSFLAIDQALHLALGMSWFGRKVRQRPAVYLYLEAGEGLRKRLEAWQQVNERLIDNETPVAFCRRGVSLIEDAEAIAKEMPDNAVLFIDTLRAAVRGIDENSPEGMGKVLGAVDKIRVLKPHSLVVIIHHIPKSGNRSASDRNILAGHSSLPGNVDVILVTQRDEEERSVWIAKARDDVDGIGMAYRIKYLNTGKNDEGEDVSSGAIVPMGKANKKVKLKPREKRALSAFDGACDISHDIEVSYSQWKEQFYSNADPDEKKDTTKQAFKEGKKGLLEKKIIIEKEGKIYSKPAPLTGSQNDD